MTSMCTTTAPQPPMASTCGQIAATCGFATAMATALQPALAERARATPPTLASFPRIRTLPGPTSSLRTTPAASGWTFPSHKMLYASLATICETMRGLWGRTPYRPQARAHQPRHPRVRLPLQCPTQPQQRLLERQRHHPQLHLRLLPRPQCPLPSPPQTRRLPALRRRHLARLL